MHLVQPEDQAKGTVILCHGYLDHSALYAPFTHFLLEQGYAVVLWDLPGHGLSSGEPADIDSFHSYGHIFADILGLAGERMPAPYSAVGHSTGASTIMEYMQRNGNGASRLEAGILVAPLVRSYAWHISQLSKRVAGFFIDRVHRVQRRITHDPDFQRFLKHVAPLTCSAVPFCWINALKKWNEEVEQWPVNNADVLVVQGTKDSVLSWKYNLEFLKRKFPNSTTKRIPGAFHHLLNESAEYREPVYQLIARELSEPPHHTLNERF
ncbi:MAG: alpha/beta hydrolase [Lentisphaeria bacterium]